MKPLVCVVGICHRDVELACRWLRWVAFLGGKHSAKHHTLLITVTHSAADHLGKFATAFSARVTGGEAKAMIRVIEDEDETGYPRSASHLFLRSLEEAERMAPGLPVFWCEPDTVPMRPTWLDEWSEEYHRAGKPFMGGLVGKKFPHLAGNSCYPADWRRWMPSLQTILGAPDAPGGKGQAWDVWCMKDTVPHMHATDLFFQVWKDRGIRPTRLEDIPARAALFHQDKTGDVIHQLAAKRFPEFQSVAQARRRYFMLKGHPSRLRAMGHPIVFSFSEHRHGWTSAVCSDELTLKDSETLAVLCGKLGISEITEETFLQVTGRTAANLSSPNRPTS